MCESKCIYVLRGDWLMTSRTIQVDHLTSFLYSQAKYEQMALLGNFLSSLAPTTTLSSQKLGFPTQPLPQLLIFIFLYFFSLIGILWHRQPWTTSRMAQPPWPAPSVNRPRHQLCPTVSEGLGNYCPTAGCFSPCVAFNSWLIVMPAHGIQNQIWIAISVVGHLIKLSVTLTEPLTWVLNWGQWSTQLCSSSSLLPRKFVHDYKAVGEGQGAWEAVQSPVGFNSTQCWATPWFYHFLMSFPGQVRQPLWASVSPKAKPGW